MNERIVVGFFLTLIPLVAVLAIGQTDVIFVAAAIAFFLLCAAYAEGCGKL